MTREDLFLAIGEVEGSRLARTELTVQEPSAVLSKEEPVMKKKRISTGRIIRNVVAAVMIMSMLGITAYAVGGFIIYDSPEEMINSIFGDDTGYDHKGVTHWTDPDKPGSVYDNPAYDRVPVDETVMAEDIMPYVSPVGQSITYEDYTLTVDAYMYDSLSGCGFVTYMLENSNGVSFYEVFENGMLNMNGGPHSISGYGYEYIIQEKTTDTCLAATFYFRALERYGDEMVISFPSGEEPLTDEQTYEILLELDVWVREEYTPEEAVAKVKEEFGEAGFAEYAGAQPEWYDGEEGWEAYASYVYLRDQKYHAEYDQVGASITLPLEGEVLNHVTAGAESVTVTPICFQIDVTNLAFLHEDINGETYIHADNVDDVTIVYEDGSTYPVRADKLDNTVFGIIDSASNGEKDTANRLTYMFNRIIDVDKVTSVVINGVELAIDEK